MASLLEEGEEALAELGGRTHHAIVAASPRLEAASTAKSIAYAAVGSSGGIGAGAGFGTGAGCGHGSGFG